MTNERYCENTKKWIKSSKNQNLKAKKGKAGMISFTRRAFLYFQFNRC